MSMTIEDQDNIDIIAKYPIIETLGEKLKRKATARGMTYINADDDYIDEIKNAIDTINSIRRFESTNEILIENQYYGLSIELALTAIAKYGAEGQSSHSENGIGRGYENGSQYPTSLLKSIVPLAKGVE